ncbi:WecB/TagA/CpsF family glycosyltransferase [Neobacillus drentensis]|uniref:WecB/TagA/CpsF family glycosyltransferase n=1 Tax=Neobacillus drentensis TaxID=220684 RepID=UPI00285E7627|nr:WecB/TagA/CpsF family glycosyltransferase [Neobacillus drentensis]MDR7240697.1 N-acetylglucosaminyldiphosphoundecaprenol N-acetyl-beta-D-mannosaminyltransferase [Neobacillus drentensis]
MKNNSVKVLGIDFANKGFDEVVGSLLSRIKSNRKAFIVTANPEIVMYAHEHPDYKKIIQSADMVVPDGFGIILASKILNTPIIERVAGYDLMVRLLELGNENQLKIYLLGGREETNQKAVANINRQYPNVQIVGSHHGFFDWEKNKITAEIKAASPDIIFVALGFPKQEQWIARNLDQFSKGLFMGVGGSIDVLAGEVQRAPRFWQKMNLEWFYRLISQPSRWRRMLAIPRFLLQIFKIKLDK